MSAIPSPTKATDESLGQKKSVDYADALRFISNIKARFLGDDRYKAFIDILTSFKNEKSSVDEVCNKVSVLLKDHVDLLVEFSKFLPSTHASLPMDQMTMMIKSLEL